MPSPAKRACGGCTARSAAGRILNAKTARSQCLGGMVWGIGMALTEELAFDPRDGHIVNHDLAEYHVPVNADVPQINVESARRSATPGPTRCRPRVSVSWASAVLQRRSPTRSLTQRASVCAIIPQRSTR